MIIFKVPTIGTVCGKSFYQSEDLRVRLSETMAHWSQSGSAHLERPSISEESVHVDRHMRFEVHRGTQRPPSSPPQREGSTTNMEGLSYANRGVELERLREQVALLQISAKKDKELLHCKN